MVGDVDCFVFGATVVPGSRTVQRLVAADRRFTVFLRSEAEAAVRYSDWRTDDRIRTGGGRLVVASTVRRQMQESVTFGCPDRRDGWIAEETEPAPPRYATPQARRSVEPAGWAL